MICAYKKSISACDGIDEEDTSSLVNRNCIHVTPSVLPSYCIHVPLCSLAILFSFVSFYLSSFLPYAAPFTMDHGVDSDVIV